MLYGTTAPRTWRDRPCDQSLPFVCEGASQTPAGCTSVELGRTFHFCPALTPFDAAVEQCANSGGVLAHPRNLEENVAIAATATAQFPVEPGALYLGAHDQDVEGAYRWLDGTPLHTPGYSPWASANPNGGDAHDCLELRLANSGTGAWSDTDCNEVQPFVCAIPASETLDGCTNVDVEGKRFAICPRAATAAAASETCGDVDGALARIDTPAEQDAVVNAAKTLVTANAYIGGSDSAVEDVWRWPDGVLFDDLRLQ